MVKIEDFIKGYWTCNLGLRSKAKVEKKVSHTDIVIISMRVKKKNTLKLVTLHILFFFCRDLSEGTKCVNIQESFYGLSAREQNQK